VIEVEAKFSIPDRVTFDRLCEQTELVGYRLEPDGIKRVRDRYLDTPDRAILSAGYACRVRSAGDLHIATLKGLGGADTGSGVHERVEYEVRVSGPDPTSWPDSPVREMVLGLSAGRLLSEVLSINQERHKRLLWKDTPQDTRQIAELSLDVVTPVVGDKSLGRSVTYFELEIELLDAAYTSDLSVLSEHMRTVLGLQPEGRSKFERGLDLLQEG
jgi:inorganic triphosphatase YgiF